MVGIHYICFKKEKRFQSLCCFQGWECACVPAPWVHTSWVWQVPAFHQLQQFLNLNINFFLTSPASPQSQPRYFCDVLSIYSLKFQKRCRACRWSRGGCWSHWHWDGMWWQSLGLRWWVMANNGIEMAINGIEMAIIGIEMVGDGNRWDWESMWKESCWWCHYLLPLH